MTTEKNDYNRIIGLLRKSKPSFDQQAMTEQKILEQVEKLNRKDTRLHGIPEILFGWAYVPSLRRVLIAASFLLVGFFAVQQSALLRQVRDINRQVIVLRNESEPPALPELGSQLTLYRLSGKIHSNGEIRITGNDLEKFVEAFNELDVRYRDLMKIIQENPDIKNYVEKKLEEENKTRPNL
jgi:hypothetical protein